MALDVDRVREIADRVAASRGLDVVEIEILGGGKARMLRVFLDKASAGPIAERVAENDPLAGLAEGVRTKTARTSAGSLAPFSTLKM